MENEQKIGSVHEELAALKAKVAELESVGEQGREAIAREVLRNHLESSKEKLAESYKATPVVIQQKAAAVASAKKDDDDEESIHWKQIQELLDYSKTHGIYNALAIVEQMNDPHFEDDFHDALVKEHLFPEK